MKNLVSVIVPVYNAEKYLKNCIDSILLQSYSTFEILIIDDGSSDNSWKIIRSYLSKDNRVKSFRKQNGGAGSARNLGLEHAQGEWVIFIDADDTIDPDYIEKLISVSQNVDLVICGMKLYKNDIISFSKIFVDNATKKNRFTTAELFQELRLYTLSGPVCKLFRRTIIIENHVSFPENMNLGEDSVFVYTYLYFSDTISVIESYGYNVLFTNNNSLTKKASPKDIIEAYHKIYEIANNVCRSKGIVDSTNLDVFYIDGLLQAINKSNKGVIKLSSEERNHCYNLIADIRFTRSLYKKFPFYFVVFKKTRLWRLYELINNIVYNGK